MENQFDGFLKIQNGFNVPYRYENGNLFINMGNRHCILENVIYDLLGIREKDLVLYHLSVPLNELAAETTDKKKMLLWNLKINVDYYIENYKEHSTYNKMIFSFKELDFFIPSRGSYSWDSTKQIGSFLSKPIEIFRFQFSIEETAVTLILQTRSYTTSSNSVNVSTISELILEFNDITDINIILKLYKAVRHLFSFICNRRNISFSNVKILSRYEQEVPTPSKNGFIKEKKVLSQYQTLNVVDNYSEKCESDKIVSKTLNFVFFKSHFEELFTFILEKKASIASIHPSHKLKHLIDLNQSLHITAAFEYYQRTFLPTISSSTTMEFYNDLKLLIEKYIESQKGAKKKKAKNFLKGLSPTLSLDEKIIKTYNGYKNDKNEKWNSLCPILTERFGDNITDLAETARKWRNELAHEKNEYIPDVKVIDSIRLIEHINYCIVLRQVGYSDSEIKEIIYEILTR